ncbi:MAG: hypothetical protein HYR95_02670 [Candidatus Colwellbacteria bacterium]|nr:hypothetical protein [Candidatus Colwellbacteria bacterium]
MINGIDHLLVNCRETEDYISRFHELLPELRNEFLCRVMKQAKQENWSVSKLGAIMSVIG